MKDPLTKQRKSSSAIPLPFEEFELVDLAFHLPIGIDECSSGKHFFVVSLQPLSKTPHVTESALCNLLHPVAESMPFTLAYHLSK
jgi:hypothetical protein